TDDDELLVIERQFFADHIRRAAEAPLPETATDEDYPVGAERVFSGQEETTGRRFDVEDVKHFRFDYRDSLQFFRFAIARQIHLATGQRRYLSEYGLLRLQIRVITRREVLPGDSVVGRLLPDRHDPLRMRKRERA